MDDEQQGSSGRGRVLSIDALRGFDMFWIVGGGTLFESLVKVWPHRVTETIHEQLEHVVWEGFRFEDLIFPLFVFLMGAVMPFSLSRRMERGQSSLVLHLHVVKRAAVLILLGMILNGLLQFDWAAMRWPGVLQRIGLCYFFAALIVMHTHWRAQAIVVAVVLLAELHGRCGYFPSCVRMRPVSGARPPRYQAAEVLDLQAVRDGARGKR